MSTESLSATYTFGIATHRLLSVCMTALPDGRWVLLPLVSGMSRASFLNLVSAPILWVTVDAGRFAQIPGLRTHFALFLPLRVGV